MAYYDDYRLLRVEYVMEEVWWDKAGSALERDNFERVRAPTYVMSVELVRGHYKVTKLIIASLNCQVTIILISVYVSWSLLHPRLLMAKLDRGKRFNRGKTKVTGRNSGSVRRCLTTMKLGIS